MELEGQGRGIIMKVTRHLLLEPFYLVKWPVNPNILAASVWLFDFSTGFRFSKISVECTLHSEAPPWIIRISVIEMLILDVLIVSKAYRQYILPHGNLFTYYFSHLKYAHCPPGCWALHGLLFHKVNSVHTSSVERFSENFDDKAVTYFIFFVGTHWFRKCNFWKNSLGPF